MINCFDFHHEKRLSNNFSSLDYQNYASKEFVRHFQLNFVTYTINNLIAEDNLSLVSL